MARIRTIKPEFWTSEQIVECSTNARLLFIGMWNFCDDRGIHPASVRRLKMEIFPGDDFALGDVEAMVQELMRNRLVTEYCVENEAFWLVSGFEKHQKIDRPTYRFPLPDNLGVVAVDQANSTNDRRTIVENSTTDHPRKGRESKGKESKGANTEKAVAKTPPLLVSLCHQWNGWHDEEIVSKRIQNPHEPSDAIQKAWKRSQANSEQKARLANLDAIKAAIQSSTEFLKGKGWFDAAALIGGANSDRRFYAEMLLNGAYKQTAIPTRSARFNDAE